MNLIKDKKNLRIRIIAFVCLLLAAVVFLAPYFWMLSNSFKSTKEILMEPANMLPKQFTISGYVKVLTKSPFFSWMRNSLLVTIVDTLVILFTSSIIGFVLSKYKFKLNKFIFTLILLTMMMPTAAMMIPNFLLISKLGWYDKIISLIFPTFINALRTMLSGYSCASSLSTICQRNCLRAPCLTMRRTLRSTTGLCFPESVRPWGALRSLPFLGFGMIIRRR